MFVAGQSYLLFLMEPICQMQSIVELLFSLVKIKQLRFACLESFIFYVSQRRKEALNECSCPWFLDLASVSH